MESDLLCFIPESLCSGFAEHIFKGVGYLTIIESAIDGAISLGEKSDR